MNEPIKHILKIADTPMDDDVAADLLEIPAVAVKRPLTEAEALGGHTRSRRATSDEEMIAEIERVQRLNGTFNVARGTSPED